ncbi:hypothetical protein [Actinoallomurus sp. NPDC050550]|uniref:hypothetical protein n=1 Tax=Actinoallomurus sp. NPDC050550 TaxID=3154937 RepID=UPI0033C22A9B
MVASGEIESWIAGSHADDSLLGDFGAWSGVPRRGRLGVVAAWRGGLGRARLS